MGETAGVEVEGTGGGGGIASGTHNSQSSSQVSRSGELGGGEAASRRGGERRSGEREERVAESGLPVKRATSSSTALRTRGVVGCEASSKKEVIPSAAEAEGGVVEGMASTRPELPSPGEMDSSRGETDRETAREGTVPSEGDTPSIGEEEEVGRQGEAMVKGRMREEKGTSDSGVNKAARDRLKDMEAKQRIRAMGGEIGELGRTSGEKCWLGQGRHVE